MTGLDAHRRDRRARARRGAGGAAHALRRRPRARSSTRRCRRPCSPIIPTARRSSAGATRSRASAARTRSPITRRFYTPENAILIVAGDVEPEEALRLAEQHYGKIRPRGERARARPPAGAARRSRAGSSPSTTRRSSSRAGSAAISRPSHRTAAPGESEALEVLAHLLGGGQTSLLYRELVLEEKKAVAAGAYYMGSALDDTRFYPLRHARAGSRRCPSSTPRSTARSPISSPSRVDADALERAKTRLVAEAIYAQDSQARWRAGTAPRSRPARRSRDVQEWPQRIEAVTRRGDDRRRAQMARSAARRHRLSAAGRARGGLRPPPDEPRRGTAPRGNADEQALRQSDRRERGQCARNRHAARRARLAGRRLRGAARRARIRASAAARRRTRRARRARRRCSPACSTKARAISTARRSSARSTRRRSRLSFHAERDHVSGRMRTLSRNLDRAGELLRLAINAPRFDEEPFERVREQMNAQLRHDANDPGTSPAAPGARGCFAGHPYAQPTDGDARDARGDRRATT